MTTVVLNTVTRKVEVFSSARDVQARAEIADHKAAANPHPQYIADADVAEVALSGDAGDLVAGTVPDARMPNWTGYDVASRAALEAANVPAAVDGLRLLGHATVGDGGGAHYKRVPSEPLHPHKIQSADGAWWEELFAVDVTVGIPSDFATLQDAIDRLSKQPVRHGAQIIVNIESGHALSAGLTVENGDYSHFTITSDDAEVTLDAGWTAGDYVAKFTNCRAPNWGILLNCNSKDCGDRAITVEDNTDLFILAGCGLKNAGGAGLGTGLLVSVNSRVVGKSTVFTGCAGTNVQVTHASTAWLELADLSGGEVLNGGGHGNVFLSRGSMLYAAGANFSGSVNAAGLKVRRSIAIITPVTGTDVTFAGNAGNGITAEEGAKVIGQVRGANTVTFSNVGGHGIDASGGSDIEIIGATFTTVGFDGIRAFEGSRVIADDVTMTGIGRDAILCTDAVVYADSLSAVAVGGIALRAGNGGVINAPAATCTGALGAAAVSARFGGRVIAPGIDVSDADAICLWATDGGYIAAPDSTGTGCGDTALRADKGGEIIAPGSDYSGATSGGAWASEGSRMTLTSTNVQIGGGTSTSDLAVSRGSTVTFWNGTGGVNTTINTLSANGVIFQ